MQVCSPGQVCVATKSKDTRSTEQVYKDSLLQSGKKSAANHHKVKCDCSLDDLLNAKGSNGELLICRWYQQAVGGVMLSLGTSLGSVGLCAVERVDSHRSP